MDFGWKFDNSDTSTGPTDTARSSKTQTKAQQTTSNFSKSRGWSILRICINILYRTLNARLMGTRILDTRVHVYFNYTHFDTVSTKTYVHILKNARGVKTKHDHI